MSVIDFEEAKRRFDAATFRKLQGAALLELFERANGRPAISKEELGEWAARTLPPKPINPFDVLTEQQVSDILKG
jgi:hypothetical protein